MVGSGIAGMFRVNVENELAGHGGPGSPQFVLRRDIHSALQGDIAAAKQLSSVVFCMKQLWYSNCSGTSSRRKCCLSCDRGDAAEGM